MEPVNLSSLLDFDRTLEIIGSGDPLIAHLTEDSRAVEPGSLFFARPGCLDDGAQHIDEALAKGAVAIATTTYRDHIQVIQLITPNVAKLMGEMASRFYGKPSHELLLIGVTGTSGKTSVTYWLRYFFESLGLPCGLIGTVEWIAGERQEAPLTTPGSLEIQSLMAQMVAGGLAACVMEVSSHSLDQERVAGLDFDAAIFTNLSPEHLDYHKTMQAYGAAKAKLFQRAPLAIVNKGDPYCDKLSPIGEIVTYGAGGECFYAQEKLHVFGREYPMDLSACAPFQIDNLLAALATLCRFGYDLEALVDLIPHFPGIPGRMEEVTKAPVRIIVDYAHKPDALEKVLQTLKAQTANKLLLVFGCGGERDRLKRPVMGRIATQYADQIWVTSDNPRGEDPLAIIEEIRVGCSKEVICEVSRMQAIFSAVEAAEPGDTLLIAGRGHESHQIIGQQRIPFNDASCATTAAAKHLYTV